MADFASRGPTPKRSDVRRRRNAPEEGAEIVKAARGPRPEWIEPPDPDGDPAFAWHPAAYNWYLGMQESGQSFFYEQSDADLAYIVAEEISRLLKPQFVGMARHEESEYEHGKLVSKVIDERPVYAWRQMGGANLSAVLKAMTNLLATEADRRRARIELTEEADKAAGPTENEQMAEVLTLLRGGQAQGAS